MPCGTVKYMVYRFIYYSVFMVLFFAQPAFAQDSLRVRTGEHKEYSRLVFDWNKTVKYKIDKSTPGALVIQFENNAKISNPSDAKPLRNFSNFKVTDETPLTVSVNVPSDSRTRAFFAGNRLVVDIYNSPGAKKPSQQVAQAPAPKPQPPVEKPKPATPEPKAEPEPEQQAAAPEEAKEEKPEQPTAPSQSALNVPAQPVEKLEVKKISKEDAVISNLISISSIKSFGMAAFQINDALWLVNDQPSLSLAPQASGPDKDKINPIEPVEIDGGTAFKANALKGYNVRGEGGGLLWRVVISTKDSAKDLAVKPVRKDVVRGDSRGGKIIWPFKTARKVVSMSDPITGASLMVVSVENGEELSGTAMDFVDFKVLPSSIGMAIMPKVDDLKVEITEAGVEVSRPGGLALTSEAQVQAAMARQRTAANSEENNVAAGEQLFDFKNWEMGGLDALEGNRNVILSSMNGLPDGKKVENIIGLGKMHFANGLGPEALGFLKLAQDLMPGIEENPEFRALYAVAKAIVSKSEAAFLQLSHDDLKSYEDIGYWRAFTLADLGDWQQAEEVLPANLSALQEYPQYLYNRLALTLAEVALRAGNVKQAEGLFKRLDDQEDTLWDPQKAAYAYLKGEAARQKGKTETTKKLWGELVTGSDDLYRAKAGLALTRLQMENKEITPQKAIDNLERLRYAWRGDELESQINYWLGDAYFNTGEFAKGLNIMRDAATYAVGAPLSRKITAEMSDVFADLFLTDKLAEVSPLDATALYEQFTELVPPGDRGNKVVEMLAERLVQADLLGRASKLLKYQIDHRLSGSEAYRVAVRLSAIELLDSRPSDAIETLKKAVKFLQTLPEESQSPARFAELSLLRARALSDQGRPDQALALLNDLEASTDSNRLKADIAWGAGYWDDAGEALGDVILDRNFSFTRPLESKDTALILQRSVALSLAGDRIALANMREKYSDLMAQTDKSNVFDVITRPRQSAALADRDTLLNIVSETDLFAEFLENYRTTTPPSN